MYKNKKIIGALLLVVFFIFPWNKVKAEEDEGLGFSVTPISNSNQLDSSSSLFYLKAEPGKEQEVSVKLISTSKEDLTVRMEVLNAITSIVPSIAYQVPEESIKRDESLVEPVSELVSFETEVVELKSLEEKIIKIKIKSPTSDYEGVKLGAISFFKASDEDNKKAIGIEAGYEVGIILANSGEQFNVGKEILLHDVKANLVRGKKMVTANIQNPTPFTIENLTIKASIIEKKGGKIVKEKEVKGGSIAPNSNFDFEIDWGLAELPAGDFTYKLLINNDFYEWPFEKDFQISGALAKDINDESGYRVETPTWMKGIAIGQVALLLVIGTVLVIRRKKLVKEFEEKAKKRKKNRKRR